MNKSQELQHLQTFADSLPSDSYLGHWLKFAFMEISADIRNDIFPTVLPSDARRIAEEIQSKAKANAADILSRADKQAAEILAENQKKIDGMEYRMKREQMKLRHAWEALEAVF